MSRHVILGKGPIGSTLASQLVGSGHEVAVLSRSGGPGRTTVPGVTYAAVDGTDGPALARAAAGAVALYNCVNPAYHRWPVDWPPVAAGLLHAARETGAVLVTAGNLYAYGAGTTLMREDSPLASTETKGRVRAAMWRQALAEHEAGRVRATEVRGSDYLGPLAEAHSHVGPRLLDPLLAGRTLRPVGSADQPHTYTYLPDFARALAAAADTPAAWGHPWHVPSPEPLTLRQLASRFAAAAGAPEPRIRPIPVPVVRAIGLVNPMMREIARVGYQFTQPFVVDSRRSQEVLGVAPTPWDAIVADVLEQRAAVPAR